jgi:hypothetical protein
MLTISLQHGANLVTIPANDPQNLAGRPDLILWTSAIFGNIGDYAVTVQAGTNSPGDTLHGGRLTCSLQVERQGNSDPSPLVFGEDDSFSNPTGSPSSLSGTLAISGFVGPQGDMVNIQSSLDSTMTGIQEVISSGDPSQGYKEAASASVSHGTPLILGMVVNADLTDGGSVNLNATTLAQ